MATFADNGSLATAALLKTSLASSKLALFKDGFNPQRGMSAAAFAAEECDFDGYTEGGKTISAFLDPLDKTGGGATIIAPTQQWVYTPPESGDPVTNSVGGWYLCLAGGGIVAFEKFAEPVQVGSPGDGVRVAVELATL